MKITDTDLALYADGLLNPERKLRLLRMADHNEGLAETLAALEASRLPFKAAFDGQTLPTVPENLYAHVHLWCRVARGTGKPGSSADDQPFLKLLLAGLLFCAAAGALGTSDGGSHRSAASAVMHDQRLLLERIVSYQSLFVPATIRVSEADSIATRNTINTFTESSGMKIVIPDLSHAGYQFTRIQELGFEGKPLIQLVYNKHGQVPLAICVMPAPGMDDAEARIERFTNLTTADWVQHNQWFVLVADEDTNTMQQIHERIEIVFSAA